MQKLFTILLLFVIIFSLIGCEPSIDNKFPDGGLEPDEWIPDPDLDLDGNGIPDVNENPDNSQLDDEKDIFGPSTDGGLEAELWFPDTNLSSQKLLYSRNKLAEAVEIIKENGSFDPHYALTEDLPDCYEVFYYFSCSEKMDYPIDFNEFFSSEGLNKDFYILIYDTTTSDHNCKVGSSHSFPIINNADENKEIFDSCKAYPFIAIKQDGKITELSDAGLIGITESAINNYVYSISYDGVYALSIVSCSQLENSTIYELLNYLIIV